MCICGMDPHSHQCPSSPFWYSPEQERYDDMIDDGSDDLRERYAATVEPSQYEDPDDWRLDTVSAVAFLPDPPDPDDLPF